MNHKISRQIVNFALENDVHLIQMEDLTGTNYSAKSKKEADRNLHSWSHYQLQQFIEYKARMARVRVQYVNPKNTSKMYKCGYVNKSNQNGLVFKCKKADKKTHTDLNAGINISKAVSGLSKKKNKEVV